MFDKVEENTKGLAASGRMTYGETANLSMNQVLMRSLNTSLVAVLPVLSVLIVGAYILGATTLQDFGLALFIGLLTGAYSSIFIATPMLAFLKEREPRYAAIKQRLNARPGGTSTLLTPAAAAAGATSGTSAATAAADGALTDAGPKIKTPAGRAGGRIGRPHAATSHREAARRSVAEPTVRRMMGTLLPTGNFWGWVPSLMLPFSRSTSATSPTSRSLASSSSDITPLLADVDAFRFTIDALTARFAGAGVDKSSASKPAGSSSAHPSPTASAPGSSRCARRASCRGRWRSRSTSSSTAPTCSRSTATPVAPGQRCLIVDDVLATGGTAAAAVRLVEKLGGVVVGLGFVIELAFLDGRRQLA